MLQCKYKMKKLSIYLANLVHVRDGHPSTDSIPLNIGFLAAYLMSHQKVDCKIRLFNLPDKLEQALENEVPDILGCSNYIWNSNLNYFYLSRIKSQYPGTVTIMGGPNYPGLKDLQSAFLKKHEMVDFYVYMEGEKSFLDLVKRLINANLDINKVKRKRINGCQFILEGKFVDGGPGERVKHIDSIPSPYLLNIFDDFLADAFTPVVQTNRGCPFLCSYCHSGNKYYNKIYKFKLERILSEIEYISTRAKSKNMYLADDNFGILPQDIEIGAKLQESRMKKGWPLSMIVATSKINKAQVEESISSLSDSIHFHVSMQSFNDSTLTEIKRVNISLIDYLDIIKNLRKKDVPSTCELILGLPEETKESHLAGIKTAIDADIDDISLYTCMLLRNTTLSENPYFNRFGIVEKFRVVPRACGKYMGVKIIEREKVGVSTTKLSIEEYVSLRGFHFIISSFYNLRALNEIVLYLRSINISIFDWLMKVYEYIQADSGKPGDIYNLFVNEARYELWDSEKALLDYYNDEKRFQMLLNGESGANLLQKYQAIFLNNLSYFVDLGVKLVCSTYKTADKRIVYDLGKYCVALRGYIFDQSKNVIKDNFCFDILTWVRNGAKTDINKYFDSCHLTFRLSEEQEKLLEYYKASYGESEDAKGKILTRINPASLSRKCSYTTQKE